MNSKLVDLFLDIVPIDGLSGNEKPVADYIRNFCKQYDIEVLEDTAHKESGGSSGNLICKIGNGGKTVLLAHMDTARPTRNAKPVVADDRIISDGTTVLGADNRAGVAILLHTISRAMEALTSPPDFTIAFTICEETTLMGSKKIELKHSDMVYVFDSALRPGNFIYRSYGAQSFKSTITGKAAHSGIAPENGISAIKIAARAIDEIATGRIDELTTVNIACIKGGEAINVVPDTTVVEGEVRSIKPGNIREQMHYIQTQFECAAHGLGGQVNFTQQWEFEPYTINPDTGIYNRIKKAIEAVGIDAIPAISAGGSDANYLNAKGMPTINIGIGAQNPHANNEFILIEDLENSAKIAWELITKQ